MDLSPRQIMLPLTEAIIQDLHTGEQLRITGDLYTARDAAHKRLVEAIQAGQPLPIDLQNQTIYYVGPAPAGPRAVIGPAGPTTSSRMDAYSPLLIEHGLRGMIGKGKRNAVVREAMQKYHAVYLAAVGGAAALIATAITHVEPVAYADLGTEAILRIHVENFPCIVCNDIYGNDLYEQGRAQFRRGE